IPNGSDTGTVAVDAATDGLIEGDETAIASLGTLPSGVVAGTSTSDTVTIIDESIPRLRLTKTASTDGFFAGDVITYTFTVLNTGNTVINNIVIDDPLTESTNLSISPSSLNPGEEGTATATYQITQEDINIGEVMNSATVIGQDPSGNDVIDISDSGDETIDEDGDGDATNDPTITNIEQTPNLALTKVGEYVDTNNDGVLNAGDQIRYIFTVENTGNVDITNIILTDPLAGIQVNGGPIDLSAGETNSNSFTAIYELTEEDVLLGSVSNQASVNGQDPNGNDVIDLSDDPNNDTDTDIDNDGDFEDETITTLDTDEEIIIYTGLTPNGDGINDQFRIVGLNNFPNNTLEIFNRWGVKVFEEDGYEQSGSRYFEGRSNGRATINEKNELPVGTYYYILKYENANGISKSKAGYLYINR
ncbi:DUF7507 domain-containing protein, partial [Aquimarina algicola]